MRRLGNRCSGHWGASTITVVALTLMLLLTAWTPGYAAADYTGKTVTAVGIAGNHRVTDSTLLAVVKTAPGDKMTPEQVKQDLQALYDLGYFYDVNANFTETPEGVKIDYTVQENPQFKGATIKGATKVSEAKLKELITIAPGNIINSRTLKANSRAIEQYYHDQGYILAKVSDVNMSPDGVLAITVNEGILEGIQVKGNVKTKTKVITREMTTPVGEPFNTKQASQSVHNLYNLGYFEDVDIKLNPGKQPNGVVLEAKIVEQKTGTFTIGGGYSATDGTIGIVELGDKNFRGNGDQVKLHWEFGGVSDKNYEISFTRPWLDSKHTSLSLSYYNMTNEYTDYYDGTSDERSTYDKRRRGFEVTLGRSSGEHVRNFFTFKNRKDIYEDYVSGPENYANEPQYLNDNFGTTRSITLSRVFDSRDNVFSPTQGKRYSISGEFAGMGGDFKFNKYIFEGRQYFKVGRVQVLAVRVAAGFATGSIPDSQRFALGGADNLRGYKDDQFKGNRMFNATVEYRFPIIAKVEGTVFSDLGKAWYGDGYTLAGLKYSVGVGVRINSPLGPLRLDYGKGNEEGRFHFSFGGQF